MTSESGLRRAACALGLTFAVGIALGGIGSRLLNAQQPHLIRTEVLRTDLAGAEGKQAHMWIAEIAPGAATGKHSHPTPRFVYVIEGSVALEIAGTTPKIFNSGQGFQENPDVVHDFRNASTTEPATALGFQIARKGQPLQSSEDLR